jgi:hypothetical protein
MGPFKVWGMLDNSGNESLNRLVNLPSAPRLPFFMGGADFYIDRYIGASGQSLNSIVKNILMSSSDTTFNTAVEPLLVLLRDTSNNPLRGYYSDWLEGIQDLNAADQFITVKYPSAATEFTPASIANIKNAINNALCDTSRFKSNIKLALYRMTERMKIDTNGGFRTTANTDVLYTIAADPSRGIMSASTNTPNLMKYEGFGFVINLHTSDPEAVDSDNDVRVGIRFFEDAAGKMKWDGTF